MKINEESLRTLAQRILESVIIEQENDLFSRSAIVHELASSNAKFIRFTNQDGSRIWDAELIRGEGASANRLAVVLHPVVTQRTGQSQTITDPRQLLAFEKMLDVTTGLGPQLLMNPEKKAKHEV